MSAAFGRPSRLPMVLAGVMLTILLAGAASAETVSVSVDEARIMKLPDNVATIVIGNPLIADASLQPGGLLVVTGKGYGSTNLIVLDRAGAVLMERSIVVRGANGQTVSVYRGMERETFSCTPDCERRITLGDSAAFFAAAAGQAEARNAQSSVAGAKQAR